MREEREKVTHGKVRERSKERQAEVLWSRENLGRRGSTAVGSRGRGAGSAGAQGCSIPRRPAGSRAREQGEVLSRALDFGRCRAFVPGIHFLPRSPGPRAQSSPPHFAESDSLKECELAPFPHSVPKIAQSPAHQRTLCERPPAGCLEGGARGAFWERVPLPAPTSLSSLSFILLLSSPSLSLLPPVFSSSFSLQLPLSSPLFFPTLI